MIKWHTRRGIRAGCNCNWCLEKWAGTRYIGYTPFPFQKYEEELQMLLPCHNLDRIDIARNVILRERERKRRIVRQRLKEAKEEIL